MNTRELWREVVGQLAKLQTAHSDMEPAFLQEELGNEFAAIVSKAWNSSKNSVIPATSSIWP
jgi:hypothetical protein